MNVVDAAYLVCLGAAVLVVIMLWLAYRKQRKTVEAQRRIDARGDRGPTLFMGNPRPKARQSAEEWEAHMRGLPPRRRLVRIWRRRKPESPPFGAEPWEWK